MTYTTPMPAATDTQNEAWMAFVTNAWSRRVAQPFLIAVMTVALVVGPVSIIQIIVPDIPWQTFIPVYFFVALESVYTTIWLARPHQRSLNKYAYRAAEFVVIVLIVRLLAWTFAGNWPDLAAWQNYLFEPLSFFSDPLFLVTLIIIFVVWQHAIYTGQIFAALSLDAAEAAYYADAFGRHKLENRPVITNRGHLIAAFAQRWLWGGLILVFCAALATFDLTNQAAARSIFSIARLNLPPAMITALLLYFLAGFSLLSQGRLAVMNARWLINGVTKTAQVERSWYRNSLRLLAIVGFVAAFLPLGSTIAIGQILGAIVGAVTAVATALWLIFLTLLSWLISLLPVARPESSPAVTPVAIPTLAAQPTPAPPSNAGETATMVFSSAFWAVAIVMTVIAVLFFLRERGWGGNGRSRRQLWTAFISWLAALWQGVAAQAEEIRQTIRTRRARPQKAPPSSFPPWRFLRINALSPREKLRYFYLSAVRRAGEQGIAREQSETPLEFSHDLKENWPEAEGDVESLTDAFLKARYSPQPIEKQDIDPVKQHWKQLRASLRRRHKPQDNSPS